jgi:hypothetical protein
VIGIAAAYGRSLVIRYELLSQLHANSKFMIFFNGKGFYKKRI